MPTYEYECLECKHRFEIFQMMNDKPISKCAKCGGSVRRLISAGAGIIFKGSGFYVNDYKKGPPSKEAKAEKGVKKSDQPSDKSSDKSTDKPKTETSSNSNNTEVKDRSA